IALIIYILVLTYNQIGVRNTLLGYIIYSPAFKYIGIFYIAPIGLITFFLTGRNIYQKLKTKESNLQIHYLLTGLLIYFIGTSSLQILMEFGATKLIHTSELSHIFLYIFIASSSFIVQSNRIMVSGRSMMGNIGDAIFLFNNEGEIVEMSNKADDIIKEGYSDKKIEKKRH
ncbi:MAG: hypothetical protein M1365_03165, partial [Actinobacteria bacterium]|nr:hypothetical protein [Actinomycetota bacterium]